MSAAESLWHFRYPDTRAIASMRPQRVSCGIDRPLWVYLVGCQGFNEAAACQLRNPELAPGLTQSRFCFNEAAACQLRNPAFGVTPSGTIT